jgi:glucosamine-phosphate N-acetyltransferase
MIEIRPLQSTDYVEFLALINEFRPTHFSQDRFLEILDTMKKQSTEIWVIELNNLHLIASGTILYETKFIHDGALYAHIEDVVVQEAHRGHGYGGILLQFLLEETQHRNCYKVLLDCSPENKGFYEKYGLQEGGLQMVRYKKID